MRLTRRRPQRVPRGLGPADPDVRTLGSSKEGLSGASRLSGAGVCISISGGPRRSSQTCWLKTTEFLSHPGAPKSEMSTAMLKPRCRRAHTPSKGFGEGLSRLFQLRELPAFLGLWQPLSPVRLCPHLARFPCGPVSPLFF